MKRYDVLIEDGNIVVQRHKNGVSAQGTPRIAVDANGNIKLGCVEISREALCRLHVMVGNRERQEGYGDTDESGFRVIDPIRPDYGLMPVGESTL